jgi:hypothetical protein
MNGQQRPSSKGQGKRTDIKRARRVENEIAQCDRNWCFFADACLVLCPVSMCSTWKAATARRSDALDRLYDENRASGTHRGL